MESPSLSSVPGEGRRTGGVNAVDPVVQLHLTGSLGGERTQLLQLLSAQLSSALYLEQIGVSECCGETEYKISFWMLRYWLEDGSVHDDQMLRSRLH